MGQTFETLPTWLQNKKIAKVSYRGAKTDHASTDVVPIRPREEDKALFVGDPIRLQIMQETLDREGVGKTRMFDANAKSGKNNRQFTEAEVEATKTAQGADK